VNVSLYWAGSFMTAVKEMSECNLALVGVQESRRGRGGTETAGEYIFSYGKGNENRELSTGVFLCIRGSYQQLRLKVC
jgi:hypothetical protein